MKISTVASYLVTACVFLAACDRSGDWRDWLPRQIHPQNAAKNSPKQTRPVPGMILPDFTQLVEKQGGAVVNIQALTEDRSQPTLSDDFGSGDPFLDFFSRIMPDMQPRLPRESRSFGSGFILSDDGYILTNAHVVRGSRTIKVVMTNKREFQAKLIGSDKRTDVALLKIDAKGLPHVQIGNPKHLKVGEWVAAIGAPFGFENSVTAGIVSAKGRNLPDETIVPFIQTDVAINPGNSGGPLFNLQGEVIGVNSQIYSRSGGFMGISFAIPIDVAQDVVEQLKVKGRVTRSQLGVVVQDFSSDLAKSFGAEGVKGALIANIVPKGAAALSGLQVGDVIVRFGAQPIRDSRELPRLVASSPPGSKVNIEVWRKGRIKKIQVQLLEQKAQETINSKQGRGVAPSHGLGLTQFDQLGIMVSDLDEASKKKAGVQQGVLIRRVNAKAATFGLNAGDVIIGLNQRSIVSVKQLKGELSSVPNAFALLIRRGRENLYVSVRLKGGTS